MLYEKVRLTRCSLNLGELHRLADFGYFSPVFDCETQSGGTFTARMRLHVCEDLSWLVFLDPRKFRDGGVSANSVGSDLLVRRSGYAAPAHTASAMLAGTAPAGVTAYQITAEEIAAAVLGGYEAPPSVAPPPVDGPGSRSVAFTCHDPSVRGGGNAILFRFINWLAEIGIRSTVYTCGSSPGWSDVCARFRHFTSYTDMCSAIEEDTVVLYSMWHIEPMLRSRAQGAAIYHLRQIVESLHYGVDYASMRAPKPVIELLEGLPLGVIAVSPFLDKYYRRDGTSTVHRITNGVDCRFFRPMASSGRDPSVVNVLTVGNPDHFVKGASVVSDALALLAQTRPDLRLRWCAASGQEHTFSPGWAGRTRNLEFASRSGLDAREMRALYNQADIFINPALHEGFGLPSLEAMACGTAVVQAENDGLTDIVRNDHDCLTVPVNDPGAVVRAIGRLLDEPGLMSRLRENGRVTAHRHSLSRQFAEFEASFRKILGYAPPEARRQNLRDSLGEPDGEVMPAIPDDRPLVSVVIPTFNQASFLGQALDSLLHQTYENWEAVVVNDGSTDGTMAVIDRYAARDPRIRAFTKPNGGITSALNYGLWRARGEFFCWLSSDDLFNPDKLELQVQAFARLDHDYALVYGGFDILHDEDGRIEVLPLPQPLVPGTEFAEALKFDFIDGCTVMVRMDVLRGLGGFNPFYRHAQDMELWMRIASHGHRFLAVDRKLTVRRVHASQASTGNMIYCRYDAAWIVNYYLRHFTLQEVYRTFDLDAPGDIENVATHLVGRVLHTESNVNHPLVQETFWTWVEHGAGRMPKGPGRYLLSRVLVKLLSHRLASPRLEYYIDRCQRALRLNRIGESEVPCPPESPRCIRLDNREEDAFSQRLFDYACELLVNPHTPLFAQELHHHDTSAQVDSPRKLSRTALCYLTQFPNRYQALAARGLPGFDEGSRDNLVLFCALRYPDAFDAFRHSLAFDPSHETSLAALQGCDDAISSLAAPIVADLRSICSRGPVDPMLHYWNGLSLAAEGKYAEAMREGWRALGADRCRSDWRVAYRSAEWAGRAGCDGHARVATAIAAALNTSLAPTVATEDGRSTVGLARYLPDTRNAVFDQDLRELPEAPLTACEFAPGFDGTYALRMQCDGGIGDSFSVECTAPLDLPFRSIVVKDPCTGVVYKINTRSLHRLWSHGYDLTREMVNAYLPGPGRSGSPGVAFTIKWTAGVGGGPAVVYRFANWLVDLGVPVTIYSSDPLPDWVTVKAQYRHIPDDQRRYEAIAERVVIVYSILELPDVLCYTATSGRAVFHLCQGSEDHNYHGADVASLLARKNLFDILHAIPVGRIVVSRHLATLFLDRFGQHSHLIENGIDLDTFRPFLAREPSRRIRVLVVGNPDRRLKGIGDVREALFIAMQDDPEILLHVDIVSGAVATSAEEARGGNPRLSVSVHDRLTPGEMSGMYRQADVLINPAWYEGFGLPTLEAMACGTPVIQADNQGLDGIVRHGANCLIVPPGSPRELAKALQTILSDANLRRELVCGGIATASKYPLVRQFDHFVPAFELILGRAFDERLISAVRRRLEEGASLAAHDRSADALAPLITVLVPAYNHAAYLPEALFSLLSQTYPNWEAVVVDDGSTDGTAEVIERFANLDPRIRMVRKENGGVASALNAGLCHALGDWICWLSSDDYFEKDALETFAAHVLQHEGARFFHSAFSTLNDASGEKTLHREARAECLADGLQTLTLLRLNFVNGISVGIHRSLFLEAGPFREDLRNGQDFDMWLRMSRLAPFHYIDHPTCVSRDHATAGSALFLDAGLFDGANACVDFLNRHSFPACVSLIDLASPEGAVHALRCALSVAASPHALMYQGAGFVPALLGRVREWLGQGMTPELATSIGSVLDDVVASVESSSLPEGLKSEFRSLRTTAGLPYEYVPVDYLGEMERRLSRLERRGDHSQARPVRAYLGRRSGRVHTHGPAAPTRPAMECAVPRATTNVVPSVITTGPPVPPGHVEPADHAHVRAMVQEILAAGVGEVIVYGAGRVGRVFLSAARASGLLVKMFVDSNPELWGRDIDSIQVVSLEQAMEAECRAVAVASFAFIEEIRSRLQRDSDYRELRIFTPPTMRPVQPPETGTPPTQARHSGASNLDWSGVVMAAAKHVRERRSHRRPFRSESSGPGHVRPEEARHARALVKKAAAGGIADVVIFGAGSMGRAVLRAAVAHGMRVHAFVDSNQSLWGTTVDGVDVVSLASVVTGQQHTFLLGSLARAGELSSAIRRAYEDRSAVPRIFALESAQSAPDPRAVFSVVTSVRAR